MASQNPVIVIPGITASVLEDRYPIEPEELWTTIFQKNFERITLHPDDLRYEAIEPARVSARNPFKLAYNDLVEALRHDLSRKKGQPTPVFAFGYDWRSDCFRNAQMLEQMIDEALARTRLLPHYKKSPCEQVDVVAHSMGGVILAAYLRCKQTGEHEGIAKGDTKVRRVVTIGTPFRGSVDAIHKMATGMGSITGSAPRDREREAARMVPALYQLLPSFEGAAKRTETGAPVDLFDRAIWQKSVVETMHAFIRLVGADIEPEALLDRFLTDAKRLIGTVNSLQLGDADVLPEGVKGWLPIVGLDATTLQRVEVEQWKGAPWFKLIDPVNGGSTSPDTGDGTVPFRGACPRFLAPERLVGVTPDDLSMWEVADRAMLRLAGFHAMLPNVNLVQRLTIRHLRDDFDADYWGQAVPGVTSPEWPKWLKARKRA